MKKAILYSFQQYKILKYRCVTGQWKRNLQKKSLPECKENGKEGKKMNFLQIYDENICKTGGATLCIFCTNFLQSFVRFAVFSRL